MITWLLASALASPLAAGVSCNEDVVVSAGADLLVHSSGFTHLPYRRHAPGGDAMVTTSLLPCLRAGGRLQVFVDRFGVDPDGPETGWSSQNKVWGAVGTELDLPARFAVSAWLLGGVRITTSHQESVRPEYDIDRTYDAVAFAPSLYVYGVIRWWALPFLGVHLDAQWTPVDRLHEYGWYDNRIVGMGISARFTRGER